MRRLLFIAAFLLLTDTARADENIYAGPPNQYITGEVSIDQGERVTFTNVDIPEHDVVAKDKGPDGKPLFRSELVSLGGSSPVAGTEYLTTGTYAFFCSIHAQMLGMLTVTAAGTPVPRPGSGGQPAPTPTPSPAPAPADTTPPAVSLRVLDSSVAAVRKRRAIRLRVSTDEAATIGLTVKAGKTVLASDSGAFSGTTTVSLKLTAKGRNAVRRAKKLTVTVTAVAVDAERNRSQVKARRSLGR